MARNVEIKARLQEPDAVAARARELADGPGTVIKQKDTFFICPAGRLKLREFGDGTGELIFYRRPDRTGPKVSDYALAPTPDAAALLAVMKAALPVRGVVAKTRTLLMCGRTRIHLDEVEGLGPFLELEVVLREGEAVADGEAEARRLLAGLGVAEDDLVEGAYIDLLASGPNPEPHRS